MGTKCSIFTRFLHPQQVQYSGQKEHRSSVELVGAQTIKIKNKEKDCYLCTVDGADDVFHAAKSHFKIEEEGPEDLFFVPLTDEEKEGRRQAKTSEKFQEPKTKWKKSEAKKILWNMILDGTISDSDNETEDLTDIYLHHEEFLKYDFGKFAGRLSALRKKVHELNDRAAQDLEAFQVYKSNHKPSLFSHKGYIQWQGSDSQELLLLDIENGKHKEMEPRHLWSSRPEYMNEFPLHAFRSKLEQELRTAKYLYTLQERGLGKKKKKKKKK